MNKLLAFIAFATFAAFVLILAVEVPSPDLVAIIVLTLILVAYDFVSANRGKRD